MTSVMVLVVLCFNMVAKAEVEQRRLTGDEIVAIFSGATLFGKYTNGRPDWAEESAVTGQLYDVDLNWQIVGTWGTIDDLICYTYWTTGLQHCFDVYQEGGQLFFYEPGTDELIAYTYRIDRDRMT